MSWSSLDTVLVGSSRLGLLLLCMNVFELHVIMGISGQRAGIGPFFIVLAWNLLKLPETYWKCLMPLSTHHPTMSDKYIESSFHLDLIFSCLARTTRLYFTNTSASIFFFSNLSLFGMHLSERNIILIIYYLNTLLSYLYSGTFKVEIFLTNLGVLKLCLQSDTLHVRIKILTPNLWIMF